MELELSKSEKKRLRFELIPGIIFGISIFLITCFITYSIESERDSDLTIYRAVAFLLGFVVFYLVTNSILKDIRNGLKEVSEKIVMRKESKIDYESDNPLGPTFMNEETPFQQPEKKKEKHYLLIEDQRYMVSKQLYDQLEPGDTVLFHVAPKSNLLLKIEQKPQ